MEMAEPSGSARRSGDCCDRGEESRDTATYGLDPLGKAFQLDVRAVCGSEPYVLATIAAGSIGASRVRMQITQQYRMLVDGAESHVDGRQLEWIWTRCQRIPNIVL
jgi:hypothetical protein